MVGFPAGSSPDFVTRLLAEYVKDYAPSIIVDNRPGAGGRLPLEALKGGERDGSLMVLTPGDQVALFPHVYAKLGYDALRDFAPISTVCMVQFLFVVGSLVPPEVKTVTDFITWCRANPKLASYGSPGEGTRPHFMGVSLARSAGVEMTHVPYKGGPPIVQDLLAGQIATGVVVVSNVLPHIQSGSYGRWPQPPRSARRYCRMCRPLAKQATWHWKASSGSACSFQPILPLKWSRA
jgi:tripartite-type tricarboxylate transporter receptor subunit TctC